MTNEHDITGECKCIDKKKVLEKAVCTKNVLQLDKF
jgi:hypothetical protein